MFYKYIINQNPPVLFHKSYGRDSYPRPQDPVWPSLGFSLKSALTTRAHGLRFSHLVSLRLFELVKHTFAWGLLHLLYFPQMLFQYMAAWFALWLHSVLLSCHLIRELSWTPYWKGHPQLIYSLTLFFFMLTLTTASHYIEWFLLSDFLTIYKFQEDRNTVFFFAVLSVYRIVPGSW